jgi:hypothetical protein
VVKQLPTETTLPTTERDLRNLLERAQSGDESTVPVLRELLKVASGTNLFGGDLARQAERSLIEAAAGKNVAVREALNRKLELLRAELAGPNPTPVEKLLVERVVACWLQVQDADIRYAQAKNLAMTWGDYYQRRMDRAHKRYLAAIKTLAVVRKLAVPVLKVNIAKKQVNVAGLSLADPERDCPGREQTAGQELQQDA